MDYTSLAIGVISGLLIGYIVATIKAKYEHARSMTKQYMGFKNLLVKLIIAFIVILGLVILYFKYIA
tara:strand:+ start:187 stop:387 length:201 start_codon:yes stop_codon:yes gene_type:complete